MTQQSRSKTCRGRNRERRALSALLAIGIGLGLASSTLAGGYENFGLGARAQSLGGAYIAIANDWTAGYWNPAGLGRIKDGSVGGDLLFVQPTMRASNSYANLAPGAAGSYRWTKDVFLDYTGLEPERFAKTSTSDNFVNPQGLGACYHLPGLFTLSLSVYQPLGYAIDWSDTIPYFSGEIYGSNWQRLISTSTQLAVGIEVAPGIYVGGGVALLYDKIKREAEKNVDSAPGPSPLDYYYSYRMDNDGFGCEGSLGIAADLTDWLSLGGVFRTGASVRLEGDAASRLTLTGMSESSDTVQKFRHPATWGIGLAVRPLGELCLSLDFNQNLWSSFRTDVSFKTPGILLQDQDFSEDWHDSEKIRLGCEYALSDSLVLRGGFCYDESPMPAKSVSLAFIPDTDKKYLTLGVGYAPGESWSFDLFGASAWGNRSTENGDFEQRIWGGGLDATWRF